jgi:hypothetical protein
LKKLENFPKENHEKKQLEEIAHLYFSQPAESRQARKDLDRRERPAEAFPFSPQALFVYCPTNRQANGLTTRFVFNLAVMLKILNGPVLLIGSQQSYEKRFLFGFRPDRERLTLRERPPIPSSSFGPMGVCLLDGRSLDSDPTTGREGCVGEPSGGGHAPFRYILSDETRTVVRFGSEPILVVLLVTPDTLTRDLLGPEEGSMETLLPNLGQVGIVVAGARGDEEANALYLYWRDRLWERCGEGLVVEDFGTFAQGSDPDQAGLGGVDVLESPVSDEARRYHETAALIRKKRSEMISVSAR